jgi:hypothetical protein
LGELFESSRMVDLGLGEIHVGSSDSDAVAPEGAALPSWRASDVPPFHFLPCTGGNPRSSPDSSGVVVALLVEGAVLVCGGSRC